MHIAKLQTVTLFRHISSVQLVTDSAVGSSIDPASVAV